MNKQNLTFGLIAAILPIVFLVLIELVLGLFDLYPQTPLFLHTTQGGQQLMQINSEVGERYFNKREIPVPNLYPQTFLADKPQSTYRIFCLGGSTTAGFPYEMTVPFPKQLELMLREAYPDLNFEVINLGLSAINSFTVLDWIPDVLDQDPDLILIYMGHNEFYGAYGTGSTISYGNSPAIVRTVLRLQKLRLVQLLSSLTNSLLSDSKPTIDATVMEKIIADKYIGANPELRVVTHSNYADNLDRILSACNQSGTPVILSNLVSNLQHQAPLGKPKTGSLTESPAWNRYQAGELLMSTGDTSAAYAAFSEARDLDIVPFRAHSGLNHIIKEKSQAFQLAFVDMDKRFRAHSPGQISGHSLFCDHLHPNPVGYKIMANAFFSTIKASQVIPSSAHDIELPAATKFVSGLDWEIGAIKIYKLQHSWPFADQVVDYAAYPPFIDERTAKIAKDYLFDHHVWGKAHEEMAKAHIQEGNFESACLEYAAIIEMYPDKLEFYQKLIDCAQIIEDWELLVGTCEGALQVSPAKGMVYFQLARAERMRGRLISAIEAIQMSLEAPELSTTQRANISFTYARFLVEMGDTEQAKAVLLALLKDVPEFDPAQRLLNKLENNDLEK